jgi:HEAT repeat protein
MAGAIEIASTLAPAAQREMVSALLGDVRTRAFAAMVLRSRGDMIPDEVLEDLLDAPDRDIRLGAAYASVVRGGENLPELLLGLLVDRDPTVKAYAARMISQSRIPIPPGSLLSFLSDRDPAVRFFLVQAIEVGTDDPNVLHRLVEMANDPEPNVSDAVGEKLVDMGAGNPRVVEALSQAQRAGNGTAADLLARIERRRPGQKGGR